MEELSLCSPKAFPFKPLISLFFIMALSGCHSVKWEGTSAGYYTELITLPDATPDQPIVSVSDHPRSQKTPLQEYPFANKSLEGLGLSSRYIERVDAIKPPENDSYAESIRVISSIKEILDEVIQDGYAERFRAGLTTSAYPSSLEAPFSYGKISDFQLYAITGFSMIRRIGMSAQLAIVKRSSHEDEALIAISETLAIDLLHPSVKSLGEYRIMRISNTDLDQPW